MIALANAKVNFTLEVLGVRPDGYHNLKSVVVPVSLADVLTIEPSEKTTLQIKDSENLFVGCEATGEDNLVMKAVRLMQRVSGKKDDVSIILEKHIPCGGGLGGGSADAASVIKTLNKLWNLRIGDQDLVEISAEIGSDIPSLVLGGIVLMEGRGEKVSRINFEKTPDLMLVLHNPGVFCSTPKIFSMVKGVSDEGSEVFDKMVSALEENDVDKISKCLNNDLASAAYKCYPEIAAAAKRLKDAGAIGVSMTGSGSTVFGIVKNESHAQEVCNKINAHGWTKITKLDKRESMKS